MGETVTDKMREFYYNHKEGIFTIALFAFVVLGFVFLAFATSSDETQEKRKQQRHRNALQELQLVEFNKCEYVLWHNGYGSDMEHHGQCKGCKDE
jgi:hypothetical protein